MRITIEWFVICHRDAKSQQLISIKYIYKATKVPRGPTVNTLHYNSDLLEVDHHINSIN